MEKVKKRKFRVHVPFSRGARNSDLREEVHPGTFRVGRTHGSRCRSGLGVITINAGILVRDLDTFAIPSECSDGLLLRHDVVAIGINELDDLEEQRLEFRLEADIPLCIELALVFQSRQCLKNVTLRDVR